jgi:hypothetical protein
MTNLWADGIKVYLYKISLIHNHVSRLDVADVASVLEQGIREIVTNPHRPGGIQKPGIGCIELEMV